MSQMRNARDIAYGSAPVPAWKDNHVLAENYNSGQLGSISGRMDGDVLEYRYGSDIKRCVKGKLLGKVCSNPIFCGWC